MKRYTSFGLLALLLLALALALASCGGEQDGEEGNGSSDDVAGVGQGDTDRGDRSTAKTPRQIASELLTENGEYSDERFIDAMVLHHRSAVEMAEVALENAEHPELRQFAADIISNRLAEMEELWEIKEREFGPSGTPPEARAGEPEEEMEAMGVAADPEELANQEPFDRAFIDAMISHNVAAIEMAILARESTANPEIRELASGIVEAQEGEIQQMTGWRREWYPEGGD